MAIRCRIPEKALLVRFFLHPAGKVFLFGTVFLITAGLAAFIYFYNMYARLIDEKLAAGLFQSTSTVYAAPRKVSLGDQVTLEDVAAQLRRSGYSESPGNRLGWYKLSESSIEISPGPESYFGQRPTLIRFEGGQVSEVTQDGGGKKFCLLEPELVTNLFDSKREKRRLVKFDDIPPVLVHAIISAEDKRFFQHSGFDPLRIVKVAYEDIREHRNAAGASTLSMQLARSLWLNLDRTWQRKLAETLMTLHLEQKLTKNEIFEYYSNEIDLGRRGSFAIRGFGEAAQVYLGKDLNQLTLADAALLAGLIQRPAATSPFRHPDRARARRNVVLSMMRENGYVSESEYVVAASSPLVLAPAAMDTGSAPYFVDLVSEGLQQELPDRDFRAGSYRVYTTLDPDLQRAAVEAVHAGLAEVDPLIERRRKRDPKVPDAQIALVALDPTTGAVKALVGGRNYGVSQLNRALAKRQPGSAFKPFVYAAALNTALNPVDGKVLTPVTSVVDEPTTFWYDNRSYEPSNFKHEFYGKVTLRRALAKSMNVATVKVAEMVGYGAVVDLAKAAGMNLNIQPTPAVALGAYEVTPIEVAGAYTVFANQGEYTKPNWISSIRDENGETIYANKPMKRNVLDPRVAYLMVNLLEEVLRSGTGAGVRSRGFTLPAAGKTGTSHDGWFAGFTSSLICVVWVGFDDNRELNLEGAHSALPIWTEFMKRAHQFPEYRNVHPFEPPDGIVTVLVDPTTGQLASAGCPVTQTEVFIAGVQPTQVCQAHGGGATTLVASWDETSAQAPPAQGEQRSRHPVAANSKPPQPPGVKPAEQPKAEEKKGFFHRVLGIFKR
jgi:penicillin-binding protein 1B